MSDSVWMRLTTSSAVATPLGPNAGSNATNGIGSITAAKPPTFGIKFRKKVTTPNGSQSSRPTNHKTAAWQPPTNPLMEALPRM